jgi:hypothetical protein
LIAEYWKVGWHPPEMAEALQLDVSETLHDIP